MAAGHRLTARAGAEALARGGGAVDAACAAAFAAGVAESPLTGVGAGGFLLARPPGGPATVLDFFVAAPGLGPRGRPMDAAELRSFTVPFGGADQVFHIGPASVAVPGMVAGLAEAAARFGRLPLAELVAPAAALAREGVVLSEQAQYLHVILGDMLTASPACAAVYAPGGRLLGAGERVRFPDLAETLETIGCEGAAAMRDGALARAIVSHLEEDGGRVTAEDLASYAVIERRPVEVGYRDVTLLTNPPPSSGGVLIAAALRALEAGPPPADEVSHYLGVTRAGFAANALRDDDFAASLHAEDALEWFWARLAAGGFGPDAAPGTRKPVGSTTHISAVDADGGMASLSSSNGSGAGVMAPGTGVLLNNMLGEEDLNPGGFGRLTPGRRLSSMMAPTLILRGGEPVVALGSAGSNRLRSAILQVVVSLLNQRLGLAASVERPRVHPEGDAVDVEGGVPEDAVAALAARWPLRRWQGRNLFFGGVNLAGVEGGELGGARDPRRGGAGVGVTGAGEVVDL